MVGWHQRLNGLNELRQLQEMVKDRETWYTTVHVVAESDTTERLNSNNTDSTQYALFELSQFNIHNTTLR